MKLTIDRKMAISVSRQIKGAIEHEIAFGVLPVGAALPSVRDLAEQAGVAPMTVSKVYGELKEAGLIEARSGSGTYVSESPLARNPALSEVHELRKVIDDVIDRALRAALRPIDILTMITARATYRLGGGRRRNVVMVGLFEGATESYARCIEDQVGHLAAVDSTTVGALASDRGLRARVAAADLVLTFSDLRDEIEQCIPGLKVLTLQFIPSEATRLALASLDPMARVGIVSRFADFLPILTLGVRRFSAHVQNVSAHRLDDPGLAEALEGCDVLILSTGADAAAAHVRPGAQKIEYRHIPDPGDVERLVIAGLTRADFPAEIVRKEAS